MAVVNITPDSFSDGGSYYQQGINLSASVARVEQAINDGATIIDIGGESTRPGSKPVSVQEEMDRVMPLMQAIKDYDVVISIDTSSPEVMREAAKCGLGLINDIRALSREGALAQAAQLAVPVCLMHMQGEPKTMQQAPHYDDVFAEVFMFFRHKIRQCIDAGIKKELLLLDPGFGFGKNLRHNQLLLQNLHQFAALGLPLLAGLSRKRMIGEIIHRPVEQRMAASVALAMLAVQNGAWIVRVHDVRETVDAIRVAEFMRQESP